MQANRTVGGTLVALMCAGCLFGWPPDDAGSHYGPGGGWAGGGSTGGGQGHRCMVDGGLVGDEPRGGGAGGGWDGGYGVPVCDVFSVVTGNVQPAFQCGCTRRPGVGTSALFCPTGIDVSASAVIGPEGGTLVLTGTPSSGRTGLRVEIRPHALESEVTVRITETSAPPPWAIIDASPMYYLEPANLMLKTPAVLKVPWSVRTGLVNPLTTYMSSDDPCVLAPLADDYVNAGFQQASTKRFGWLVIGSPRDACTARCP